MPQSHSSINVNFSKRLAFSNSTLMNLFVNITLISQYPVCEMIPQSQKDQRAVLVALASDFPPTCRWSGGRYYFRYTVFNSILYLYLLKINVGRRILDTALLLKTNLGVGSKQEKNCLKILVWFFQKKAYFYK